MRTYPKGCRYIVVAEGIIGPQLKTTKACDLWSIVRQTNGDAWHVIVQPRGRLKWYHFRGLQLIEYGHDPDVLAMKALLSG